jgi:hypothetical protein
MGALFSSLPSVAEPSTFTINKKTGLTNDQIVYILATYGASSRRTSFLVNNKIDVNNDQKDWFFLTLSKHSGKERDSEFYGRYLVSCGGKVRKEMLKKFNITDAQFCLAHDYSAAAYKIEMKDKSEIKKLIVFDAHTSSLVKQINDHLQKFNGYGGREKSCYK